jgi:hypothetical protein
MFDFWLTGASKDYQRTYAIHGEIIRSPVNAAGVEDPGSVRPKKRIKGPQDLQTAKYQFLNDSFLVIVAR